MVNSATAMLQPGDHATPLRALIYLDVSQEENGGFSQNFLDTAEAPIGRESSWMKSPFPLSWPGALKRENALEDFDPYRWFIPGRCVSGGVSGPP